MVRILASTVLLVSSVALAAPVANSQPATVLPGSLDGWTIQAAKDVPSPASPDEAAVLQEYGLAKRESATYINGPGSLVVQTWQFKDATGAYGAFTYFRQPQMRPEKIGHEGAVAGDHHLFWNGTTVVDATFSHPANDEQGTIQALAAALPKVMGAAAVAPTLPHYLPTSGLDPASIRYAIGPAAYTRMGGALPANQIDFSQDAESISARYGQETLTIVSYPTPQMAAAHLKTIEAAGLTAKRTGPLVAAVSGSAPAVNVKHLLDSIRFDDYVTINHPEGYVSETMKVYRLLVGIGALVLILICAAILLGLFLGGGRALLRKLQGKPVSTVSEEEFISLHLGS